MRRRSPREIYFSFFMFTVDLRPEDQEYTQSLVRHMRELDRMGYDGFDLHIADRPAGVNHQQEVDDYRRLKQAFDKAGFADKKFATNVGTTGDYDPTSPYLEQRKVALNYLKSRVKITKALGGEGAILSGPFLYPYGEFPKKLLWSGALQDWILDRLRNARSVLEELADYAAANGVKLALEPVKNWETPPPNMVSEVLDFVENLCSAPCGITIDTAQVLMESQGPKVFKKNVARAAKQGLLNYVHISPPDRGAVHDSWIPWDLMLGEIEPVYDGPYLIEIFNAIPPFDALMRMSRRGYWWPEKDGDNPKGPPELNAYYIAEEAIKELRQRLVGAGSSSDEEPGTSKTSAWHEAASHRNVESGKITFGMKLLPTTSADLDTGYGSSGYDTSDDVGVTFGSEHPGAERLAPAESVIPKPGEDFRILIAEHYGRRGNAVRIHTFIASYTANNLANATHVIESAKKLVIVDGQFLVPYAEQFRRYVDSLSAKKNKKIERVFLSHRHPDHWFGMPAAFPDQTIYALPETILWIEKNGEESLRKHVTTVGKDLAPKTHKFTKKEIELCDETIDGVKYVFEEARNAEVESQLIIKLPDHGVAIVQDLIYSGTHLYLTKDMGHWRAILQELALSDCEIFLPGHGEPADKKELHANIEYLIAAQRAFDDPTSTESGLRRYLETRYPERRCRHIFDIYLPRLYGRASEV